MLSKVLVFSQRFVTCASYFTKGITLTLELFRAFGKGFPPRKLRKAIRTASNAHGRALSYAMDGRLQAAPEIRLLVMVRARMVHAMAWHMAARDVINPLQAARER
jgi:hypothetical protein